MNNKFDIEFKFIEYHDGQLAPKSIDIEPCSDCEREYETKHWPAYFRIVFAKSC
jgi:hypothetical protein